MISGRPCTTLSITRVLVRSVVRAGRTPFRLSRGGPFLTRSGATSALKPLATNLGGVFERLIMGESHPPTTADYAWAAANDAKVENLKLERRIENLERTVALLIEQHNRIVDVVSRGS